MTVEERLDSLEKHVEKIFERNREYYRTQDGAKAEALELLLVRLFRECLDRIGER